MAWIADPKKTHGRNSHHVLVGWLVGWVVLVVKGWEVMLFFVIFGVSKTLI